MKESRTPQLLSTSQFGRANTGTLFASFGNVWDGAGAFVDCSGTFLTRERMSCHKTTAFDGLQKYAPMDNYQGDRARKNLLQRLSQF